MTSYKIVSTLVKVNLPLVKNTKECPQVSQLRMDKYDSHIS